MSIRWILLFKNYLQQCYAIGEQQYFQQGFTFGDCFHGARMVGLYYCELQLLAWGLFIVEFYY